MDEQQYDQGGFIPGGPVWMIVDPDECIGRPGDDGLFTCRRGDHPTPTSDCTTKDWIRHA